MNHPSPLAAARRLAHNPLSKGYQFEALHEYTNETGPPLFWRIRLKHSQTGKKWIRPMHQASGTFRLGEPTLNAKPLYNLPALLSRQEEPVVLVEGEWCADHLMQRGVLATTTGAADSAHTADWSPLGKRQVIIWPDNDTAGQRYAVDASQYLEAIGCRVETLNVARMGLPDKGDAVDWLELHPSLQGPALLEAIGPHIDQAQQKEAPTEQRQNLASLLVDFVTTRATLFHDQNRLVYAQLSDTLETLRLDGQHMRDWLLAHYYKETGISPRDQSMREAIATLTGLGRHEGECAEVYLRVAQAEQSYYLDLGEAGNHQTIEITARGWQLASAPLVRFIRQTSLRPLPLPVRGGGIETLWQYANIPEDARLLVIAWLCDSLRPDTPFPVLELIGEQGSAKSTTQRVLRRMIDPNGSDLRSPPKTVEDLFVGAGANWLVSYENISHLSHPLQDGLCTLATGGGYAKRKLYTDADETVIDVKRPVILNGISAAITAQDLIDRSLTVETPTITDRQEVTGFWRRFEHDHAQLLGALLDILSSALALLPQIHLPPEERPRLTEFAYLGMAVAEAMGFESTAFLQQFNASRSESIARTIDASPVASATLEWFEERARLPAEMSVKMLMKDVERFRQGGYDTWPRSPKGFADALRRAAPALRQYGIECRSLGKIGGTVQWRISSK